MSMPMYAYTGGRPFEAAVPCVVFIHGALNDHSVWTLAARWCAHHGHNVLAVDLPGHGRSAGPALPDVEAMADAMLALLAGHGVQQAALVGHSMGSLIALEAASRAAPGLISHLVMVGTAYPMRVSPALLATAAQEPLTAIEQVVTFSHASMAAKPSYPGPGAWLHGASRALMRQVLARGTGVAGIEHNPVSYLYRYSLKEHLILHDRHKDISHPVHFRNCDPMDIHHRNIHAAFRCILRTGSCCLR